MTTPPRPTPPTPQETAQQNRRQAILPNLNPLKILRDLMSDLQEGPEKLDSEIATKHQTTIIEMLSDYLGSKLNDTQRKRHAQTLSETLLGFREPIRDDEFLAILKVIQDALLKVELIYSTEGLGFEICMRLFITEVKEDGKHTLKKISLKRRASYDDLPATLREGVHTAKATGDVLIITLLSPPDTH